MDNYYYELPQELVALEPAVPRDSSRLMVYDTSRNAVMEDTFANIAKYIPRDTLMVLNSTRVLPSRIILHKKSTGGKVVVLILLNEITQDGDSHLMLDREVRISETLGLKNKDLFTITSHKKESIFVAKCLVSSAELLKILDEYGTMPTPLYLRKTGLGREELKEKYQTVFARNDKNTKVEKYKGILGSVAAPTASLHFTEKVFERLSKKGIEKANITLEVGLGTFATLTEKNIEGGKLHEEWYKIDKSTKVKILEKRKNDGKILACGTTSVRCLESWGGKEFANQTDEYVSTDIFIKPGHNFQIVDMMLTNFHIPKSSLMMLVEAFLQSKNAKRSLVSIYEEAIEKKYRFYSFGDAMLII